MNPRQDNNNKYQSMENMMFGQANAEQNPPRHYFSNFRNYDIPQNDSFYQGNASFKGENMDFRESGLVRNYPQQLGNGYNNNNMEFKFSSTNAPPMNQHRAHQASFSNLGGDQTRFQSYGPDYPGNVMNPNSTQYSSSMNQPGYFMEKVHPQPNIENPLYHNRK
jgi:hypothetical protein